MNTVKNGNLIKAVAFFVIIAILALTLVIVANGWQDDTMEPDNSEADGENSDTPASGDADNDTPPTQQPPQQNTDIPNEPNLPSYLCPISGLESTEEISKSRPLVFTIDLNAPTYGISGATMIIEVPFENGATRSMLFTYEGEKLGKLGSITYTRDVLDDLAKDFGGISVSLGNDSHKSNIKEEEYNGIDLSINSGYHYTEYSTFCYTNADLVKAMIKNLSIDRTLTTKSPFNFIEYFDKAVEGDVAASSITVNYGVNNKTSFNYNKDLGEYTLSKNGMEVRDLLNDKKSTFDNLFILFSDSTTYETDEYTETVLDLDCGEGLYFTRGTVYKISWTRTENGTIELLDEFGNSLKVNRGRSYISFVKASMKTSVEYS